MSEFEVGDKIAIYGLGLFDDDPEGYRHIRTICKIDEKDGLLCVSFEEDEEFDEENNSYWVHPKQCRRLVKKVIEHKICDCGQIFYQYLFRDFSIFHAHCFNCQTKKIFNHTGVEINE